MKGSILLGLAIVVVFSLAEVDAFCGGCGCNVWGCNCDWRPNECKKRSVRDLVLPINKSSDVLEKADFDKDGLISLEEFSEYFKSADVLKTAFHHLDVDGDEKLSLKEIDN